MYKIGTFSKINKISKRMLRYYDEQGILCPSRGAATGYRYYTDEDVERITRIKQLRKYTFTVEEMRNILNSNMNEIAQYFSQKASQLEQVSSEYNDLIDELTASVHKPDKYKNTYNIYQSFEQEYFSLNFRRKIELSVLESLIEVFFCITMEMEYTPTDRFQIIFHNTNSENDEFFDVELALPIVILL